MGNGDTLMSGDLENRIQALEAEVQRLRAREEIIHTFNQYLYGCLLYTSDAADE